MKADHTSQGQNPLLLPFSFPPFQAIEIAHYQEAIEHWMQVARERIQAIVLQTDKADFTNTIEALEQASTELDQASSILFNLHSAETSEDLEQVTEVVSPMLSAFSNDILLNQALYERVESVWNQREQLALDHQEYRLLEKTFKAFQRNGASLSEEKKQALRKIDEELALASIQFGQVVLNDTNAYFLHVSEEQLEGLPDQAMESAKEEAKKRGLNSGGVITLQYPSYVPAMTYLKDRSIREQLFRAFGARGLHGEKNNRERVFRIAQLRKERAALLGYSSHAQFVLEERMAKSPENVLQFLDRLKEKALPAAQKELEALQQLAQEDGIELAKWDTAYYSEKHKQKLFALDSEKLKPYFPLESVLQGAFQVAHRLYGISFQLDTNIPVYHPDVAVYRVMDTDGERVLAWLYTDFFPRSGKRAGAWMTSFRDQFINSEGEQRPLISIVCNFTPPTGSRPSLLSFQEVTTLFHEFGHALHGILAEGRYASINGTHVYWDFVELPSQLMENWCYEAECLSLFARHYQTDELIPAEEIERIRKAANHMEGLQTLRQLSFGQLDLRWHHLGFENYSLEALENEVMQDLDLLPRIEGTATSTAFSHIFQGGYSAGYYSYKWAEVLDADAFEYFKQEGIFHPKVAQAFRQLLQSGGQTPPDQLYRNFRGRDADPDALLRRAGLLHSSHS